jgi:hypothetical protein
MDAAACTVTATAATAGHYWAELGRDDAISDPEDRFVVLVGNGVQDVQVRFRLDEFGVPLALHSRFNDDLLGGLGLTLLPGLPRQFVWWFDTPQDLWQGERPLAWEAGDMNRFGQGICTREDRPPQPTVPRVPRRTRPARRKLP